MKPVVPVVITRLLDPEVWQTLPVATRKLPAVGLPREPAVIAVVQLPAEQVLPVPVGARAFRTSYATTTPEAGAVVLDRVTVNMGVPLELAMAYHTALKALFPLP